MQKIRALDLKQRRDDMASVKTLSCKKKIDHPCSRSTFGIVRVSLAGREEGERKLPDARFPGFSVNNMHPHAVLRKEEGSNCIGEN